MASSPQHLGSEDDHITFDDSETPLIIGGRPSEKGRWPWLVSMSRWREEEDRFRHNCGGTLLTPTIVMTAAHCVDRSQ